MHKDYLNKANENLKIAQISFEYGCYNACANRAYYAGFQAAVAALLAKGFQKTKLDHKWVQAEFSEKLIKRQKVYPGKLKSYLLGMQMIRNKADYEPGMIGRKTAVQQIAKAEEMIKCIAEEIEK